MLELEPWHSASPGGAVKVHMQTSSETALALRTAVIGINNRNLKTFARVWRRRSSCCRRIPDAPLGTESGTSRRPTSAHA